MNKKKLVVIAFILAIIAALAGAAVKLLGPHEHSFGEWKTAAAATCDSAAVEVRTCQCGEQETRDGAPASGHMFVSIAAESKLEKLMAGMVMTASDVKVTGLCSVCGNNAEITDGIKMDAKTLSLGKNVLTVKVGELSAEFTVEATEPDLTLDGVVSDDTYVYSGKKDGQYTEKNELGTKSSQYRVYFRLNIKDIL